MKWTAFFVAMITNPFHIFLAVMYSTEIIYGKEVLYDDPYFSHFKRSFHT